MEQNVNYSYNPTEPMVMPKPKPKRQFNAIEAVYAWLCLLSGYLFCRAVPVTETPIGGLAFILFLYVLTFIVLIIKKCPFKVTPIIFALSGILISFSLLITGNGFLHFFSYVYAIVVYCYFVYSSLGNALERGFSNYILMDFFKATFIVPFYAIGHVFRAMFSGKIRKGGKFIGKLLLGLAVAVIPTAIVIALLSYDSGFSKLLNDMFDWDFNIMSHLGSVILGVPVGMYMFGLFVASTDQSCKNVITKERCNQVAINMHKVPVITAFAAVVPLLFVYVVFFISQWDYYMSAFTGILPEDFTYADYAREGFFQLCAVAFINFIIILCVVLFVRRKEGKKSFFLSLLSIVFALFTLVLIGTAMSKLVMYIQYYGLTHKRIYAAWFMIVLAVIFIMIILYQFVSKMKVTAICTSLVIVLFAGLTLGNIDGKIAEYNVNNYIDGKLSSVDIYELYDLGDAAIPAIVELTQYWYEKDNRTNDETILYRELNSHLNRKKQNIEKNKKNIWEISVPYLRAKRALEFYCED